MKHSARFSATICAALFKACLNSTLNRSFGATNPHSKLCATTNGGRLSSLRPFIITRGFAGSVTLGFFHHLHQFHVSRTVRRALADDLRHRVEAFISHEFRQAFPEARRPFSHLGALHRCKSEPLKSESSGQFAAPSTNPLLTLSLDPFAFRLRRQPPRKINIIRNQSFDIDIRHFRVRREYQQTRLTNSSFEHADLRLSKFVIKSHLTNQPVLRQPKAHSDFQQLPSQTLWLAASGTSRQESPPVEMPAVTLQLIPFCISLCSLIRFGIS